MGLGSIIKKVAKVAVPAVAGVASGGTLAPALIGAGADIAGGLIGNAASASEAAASRGFTEKQMKNKHQWEAADLEAAGLNRILGYTKGGASLGSSASASQQNPVGNAVSNALLRS